MNNPLGVDPSSTSGLSGQRTEPATDERADRGADRTADHVDIAAEFERESARLQAVLAELSVMDRRDIRDVFATLAATAAATIRVGRVSLWRYNATHSAIECVAVWHDGALTADTTTISDASHPTYWSALQATRSLPITDAQHDPLLVEFRDDYVRPLGIGAMLDSSIRVEQKTIGIVCMEHLGEPRRWTALERGFVASLADRMGLAVLMHEHRRLEQALAQTHKMEALGLMAGGLAHDFNNVLSVVLTSAEMARTSLDTGDDPRPDLAAIRDAATRAAAMTRRLLTVARRETMLFETFDLNAMMREFHAMARRLVPRSVELALELGADSPVVSADRAFLDQAMLNLVTNAVQAMPHGGRVTIETATVTGAVEAVSDPTMASTRCVRLSVRDTGGGIEEHVLPRIFDPFFTTKGDDGTGLGLAVVYGGMRQHGGAVTVESQLGRGSAFNLLFPLRV